MTGFISNIDAGLRVIGGSIEAVYRGCRKLGMPQYNYVSLPIYKACAGKIGQVAAVGVTILATDLIMHQLGPRTAICLSNHAVKHVVPDSWGESINTDSACTFSYDFAVASIWGIQALLIMYAKYRRAQEVEKIMKLISGNST